MSKIFITGIAGLVGKKLRAQLETNGHSAFGCDLRAEKAEEKFDLRDSFKIHRALQNADGIVHLGAVSRVIWGEQNPALCESVNVGGMECLAKCILDSPRRPWLLFASSREVYGNPSRLPCGPASPLNPGNTYARTKAKAESIVADLRAQKGVVAVLRLSNVFGATDDHHDRVAPAFARAAACGGILRVEGEDNFFDFNDLSDTADAIAKAVEMLDRGVADLPPLDIVTGRATSLRQLAEMALAAGSGEIVSAPSRNIGAERFQGDPHPAQSILGWRPTASLEQSMANLVGDFRRLSND